MLIATIIVIALNCLAIYFIIDTIRKIEKTWREYEEAEIDKLIDEYEKIIDKITTTDTRSNELRNRHNEIDRQTFN